jgi:hypothetical protein
MGNAIVLLLLALWFAGHHRIALVATIAVALHLCSIRRTFRH